MTEHGVLRRIEWRELFPWLILLRVFRVAIAPGPIFLALLALAVCSAGWWLSGALFLKRAEFAHLRAPQLTGAPIVPLERRGLWLPPAAADYLPSQTEEALQPFTNLIAPVQQLLHDQTPGHQVAYYLFGLLISAAVWGFVGGVIARQALMELGAEQPYDWFDSVRFVARRYLQYVLAPLAPLGALVCLGLLIVPLGWLMHWPIGVLLAGLVWILVLALGLVAAWLIVGLLFGWPLMFGVIGSKRDGDALQAFSDAFSYVYGKPLHYFFYAVVAISLGVLALTVIHLFANLAIDFGFWAASWGAGAKNIAAIRNQLAAAQLGQELQIPRSQAAGIWLIGAAIGLVRSLEMAAAFSYFFVSATAIFLLMRHAVDDKEMDEVHFEDEEIQIENARRAMLSDENPLAQSAPPRTAEPTETVAVDTASPTPLPPPVVTTESEDPPLPPADRPAE